MAQLRILHAIKTNQHLAFHYANYNWFLTGSFFSRTGEWFDRVALNWFIFTLTGSAFYIGLVEFCRLIPILFFGIIGGMVADRWDRRKILIWTQVAAMITTWALAFVMFQMEGSLFYIFFFLILRGVFLAFELPARNALVPNLVPPHAMGSALSFFSAVLNTARIIGPALAGILLSIWSAPTLVVINGVSFIAVILSLFMINKKNEEIDQVAIKRNSANTFLEGFKEAVSYLKSNRIIFGLFILGIVPMLFAFPYITLMPIFAHELLDVGSKGFGLLLSFAAIGAVVCSVGLGWGKYPFSKAAMLFGCIIAFGGGLVLFSFSHIFIVSLFIMFVIGMVSQGYRVIHRLMIQEMVPDHLRGRILSIITLDAGLLPLGNLIIGFLAAQLNATVALIFMGMMCILASIVVRWWFLTPSSK